MVRSISRYGARPLDARPRLRKALWWLAGIVAFIAVFGFLIAPPIVRWQAEKELSALLDRPVTIEKVAINPFALSARIDGLRVGERSGNGVMLAFDSLYGRLSYQTLIRFAPVVAEGQLERPFLHLVRTPEKTYNFQDLVEKFGARSPAPASGAEPKKPARFSLNNLRLVDGKVELDDQLEKQKHAVTGINVDVPLVSNFDVHVNTFVQPRLEAVVNGDPLRITGETKPFKDSLETRLALNLSDVDLPRYLEYSPVRLPFTLPSGKLDAALTATFVQSSKEKSSFVLGGNIALREIAVVDAAGARVLGFSQLGVVVNSLDVFGRKADIARIGLESPALDVRRERDGSLNLAKLVPRGSQSATGAEKKPSAPFAFEIGEIAVTKGTVMLADLVPEKPFRRRIEKLEIGVHGLRSADGSPAPVEVHFDSRPVEGAAPAAAARVDYTGIAQLTPLRVGGKLQVLQLKLADLYPYYAAAINAEPVTGNADVSAAFDLSLQGDAPSGRVSEIAATLDGVRLRLPDARAPFAEIASISIRNGEADLGARRVTVGRLVVDSPVYSVVRESDGSLNAARLFKAAPADAPQPDAAPPWVVAVSRFELGRGRVAFEDRTVKPSAKIALRNVTLEGDGLSTAQDAEGKIAFRTVVNRGGAVSVRGKVSAAPSGALAIAVSKIDLVPFKPYLAPHVKADLASGSVSTRGTLTLRGGARVTAAYKGDFEMAALALRDGKNGGDLLKWQSLRLGGIDVASEPLRASIGEIALADFFARLVLDASGQLNLRQVAQEAEPGAGSAQPAKVADAEARQSPEPKRADEGPGQAGTQRPLDWLRIGAVRLRNGNIDFSDFFVRPNYRADLTDLKGSISTLTFEQPGELELSGTVNQVGKLEVRGNVNPFAANLALDIGASARDIELPRLSPYSAKYLGYGIDRGKLSVKVKYLLKDRRLTAENNIYLDQLKLGAKVVSPDAADLPVPLAVSLLQDRNGVIDVTLPIGGSLDDPQFSIGGIVMQVIGNIITKAVTAPFALLGSVAGAGGDLDYLEFDPGSARLTSESQKKLAALAKALADRPGIKLDITGRADPASDREGLKRSAVERAVKQQKFDALRDDGKAPKSVDDVTVDPKEYPALLERAYGDADIPDKPRNFLGFAKDIPVAEMEKLMLASVAASDEDLRDLALRRAQAAKDYLTGEGKIAAARVFIVAPKVATEGAKSRVKPARVEFALR